MPVHVLISGSSIISVIDSAGITTLLERERSCTGTPRFVCSFDPLLLFWVGAARTAPPPARERRRNPRSTLGTAMVIPSYTPVSAYPQLFGRQAHCRYRPCHRNRCGRIVSYLSGSWHRKASALLQSRINAGTDGVPTGHGAPRRAAPSPPGSCRSALIVHLCRHQRAR